MTAQNNNEGNEKPFGFINVHKPAGITSHDVVNKVRRLVGVKQVGHGGTLDPLAEGVLPIAVGAACRFLRFLPQGKTYVAEILLGQQTTTDDIEGDIIRAGETGSITEAQIRKSMENFQGEIDQIPPIYSAIHVDGKRLYELARAGKADDVEIKPRRVTIFSAEILEIKLPVVKVRIACSSGTYIRSIARDLGEQLGCFGCLQSLVREQAGLFWLDKSVTLDQIAEKKNHLHEIVIDPVDIFSQTNDFNRVDVDATRAKKIRMGQRIPINPDSNGSDKSKPDSNSDDSNSNLENNSNSSPENNSNPNSNHNLNPDKPTIIVHDQKLIAFCSITEDQLLKPEVVVADGQNSN